MSLPSRDDVSTILKKLLAGELTRQAASEWATPWLIGDELFNDREVRDAVVLLGMADLISTDRPFLYNDIDFVECLKSLEQ